MRHFDNSLIADFERHHRRIRRGSRATEPNANSTSILLNWLIFNRNSYNFTYARFCSFAINLRIRHGYNIQTPPCTREYFEQRLENRRQDRAIVQQPTPQIEVTAAANTAPVPIIETSFLTSVQHRFYLNQSNLPPTSNSFIFTENNLFIVNITPEIIRVSIYNSLELLEMMIALLENAAPRILNTAVSSRALINANQLTQLGERASPVPDRFKDFIDAEIMDVPVQIKVPDLENQPGIEDWVVVGVVEEAVYDQGTLARFTMSPISRTPLSECTIIPDLELKEEIDTFMAAEMAKNTAPAPAVITTAPHL